MYTIIYFVLILIIFVCIVRKAWSENLISGGPPEFILYYDPMCAFCQAMMPEWDKLEAINKGCAKIFKVNIVENPYFPEDRGTFLQSVPAVYFYPYGRYNSSEEYTGDRKAEAMLYWLYNKRLNFLGICNQEPITMA